MKRITTIACLSMLLLYVSSAIAADKVVVVPLNSNSASGGDGQIQYNDGGREAASGIYYRKTTGNVGIGNSSPSEALDVSGNVKANSFIGDGSSLTGVVTSETDPTVDASVKDGVDWTEVTNRPAAQTCPPYLVMIGIDSSGNIKCAPENKKYVFVTSANYNGSQVGGLSGADAKCATAASNGGLSGTFMAWLSDSTLSPSNRFTTKATVPYVLLDGTIIASNWTDLTDGNLSADIRINENGFSYGGGGNVWTNTKIDGTLVSASNHCGSWGSTSGASTYGRFDLSDGSWTRMGDSWSCIYGSKLYCFEQ